ncbi:phasin family protein [Zoogloea sp.]|uniref:phasin family protein n=1 Tax=Zoogloea sp. TaxID=49181 RepID=UPI0031FC42F3
MAAMTFEQFGRAQAAAMDSMLAFSRDLAGQVEKVALLQFEAGRQALESVQALAEVRDAESLAAWQATALQSGVELASDNVRQQYAVLVEMRNLLAEAVRQSAAETTQQVQAGIERLVREAPEGFAPFFAALRDGFNTQLAAMENFGRIGAQVDALTGTSQLIAQAAEPAPRKRAPVRRKAA